MNKVILSIHPNNYLKQGISHCGAYSVKAILEAYDKNGNLKPTDYHSHWFGKLTGLTLGKHYYERMLEKNGVKATTQSLGSTTNDIKLTTLKNILKRDSPVMLRIGNGYQFGTYNRALGIIQGHWITLWGFDDSKQIFYVYDSALKEKYRSKNLPIGNTTRTFQEILRDWNFGHWQFWWWPFAGKDNNLYIEIIN